MTMLDKVVRTLEDSNPDALLADDIEDALIGVAVVLTNGKRQHLAAYSMQKVIEVFMRDRDMSYEEAYEYASINTFSANVGENTPIYIDELREVNVLARPLTPEEMYEF
jgi:hypothetical protein|tara:strand:+ start:529 stop:855 length:327 start_codon:yes stop_codon:yes gene_type:complete